ncbi:MAG: VWA domain-containing protein [Campylobacteraceae bacterium]|jgi:Ca-activated chloride channel family protein|nr:VWA domain-containing protein [Campylobacteraceae bacterium]MBT4030737.1 VWA domain-containing protein [Campylobacteraceae bacterium]MBT4178574.1 VWA domain-containing protein [Campylobacteraceae bacterium]MBT4572708.1 VWA domain-containing protein [Campylobacteraceae bacterium]MBT4708160.1 VWA domain-containing protein [Campylobacteraceae bacterium]
MISFDSPNAFYVLALLIIVYFVTGIVKNYENYFSSQMLEKIIVGKNSSKIKLWLLIFSFIFLIIALARPIIIGKPIKIAQSNLSVVVAFDISRSMSCEDVYPNRLQFSQNKFNLFLENIKDTKVGVIGFSSRSFLVAPITNDYSTLKYLVQNLNQQTISVNGSSVYEALETTNNLLQSSKQKALIVFTDGTDDTDFSKSIEFAKDNNIKVFVYAVATKKGGVIPLGNDEVQKDSNGNIVITNLNENIKELAFQSGGAYLEFSSSKIDIKEFINTIKKSSKKKEEKDVTITDNEELFYYPLLIALILFLVSISGFRKTKR